MIEDMEYKAAIAKKLSAAVHATGWVKKSGTNKDKGYKYSSASDVFDAINDAFFENGLASFADTISVDYEEVTSKAGAAGMTAKLIVRITIMDTDTGYSISAEFPGVGICYEGKATNKAITYARKYGLLGMLGLPTGDDPDLKGTDGDKTDPPPATPKKDVAKVKEDALKLVRNDRIKSVINRAKSLGVPVTDGPSLRAWALQMTAGCDDWAEKTQPTMLHLDAMEDALDLIDSTMEERAR